MAALRLYSLCFILLLSYVVMGDSSKTSWPELVGRNGQEAVDIIKRETGFTNVMTLPEGSMVTMDYRDDRVRVFVDANGNVAISPQVA